MMAIVKCIRLLLLLSVLAVAPGCCCSGNFQVNAVTFSPTNPTSGSTEPAPGVWIDTHVDLDFLSGTLASSKPYDVSIDFTDSTTKFAAAEFTSVEVIYDDGTIDPAAATLKLPLRIDGREYEAVNSTSDGEVVKSKLWIISGKLPGVITRDQPFTLRIDGQFINQDGSTVPFTIDQHYDMQHEKGTMRAADVVDG